MKKYGEIDLITLKQMILSIRKVEIIRRDFVQTLESNLRVKLACGNDKEVIFLIMDYLESITSLNEEYYLGILVFNEAKRLNKKILTQTTI